MTPYGCFHIRTERCNYTLLWLLCSNMFVRLNNMTMLDHLNEIVTMGVASRALWMVSCQLRGFAERSWLAPMTGYASGALQNGDDAASVWARTHPTQPKGRQHWAGNTRDPPEPKVRICVIYYERKGSDLIKNLIVYAGDPPAVIEGHSMFGIIV